MPFENILKYTKHTILKYTTLSTNVQGFLIQSTNKHGFPDSDKQIENYSIIYQVTNFK